MISFFKNFGKGILYVLVLPFLLVGMALYGVVAFFVFLFLCVKGLILFFSGRSLYEDLPEDKEAKKRLAMVNNPVSETATPSGKATVVNTTPIISATSDADPFYVPEYLKEEGAVEEVKETPVIEETFEEEPIPEEEISYVEEEKKIEPEEAIIIEKKPQNSTILEIDEDDDDSDSGVNIDFD